MVETAVTESETEVRRAMYEQIQREFQAVAPFAVMFQQSEQAGINANVKNLTLGSAVTAVSYWPVSK